MFGRNNMKLFDQFKNLITNIKEITSLLKQLQLQQHELTEQLKEIQSVSEDIQSDIEKMNFKNQPHISRIDEATEHLNTELSKFKAH